MRLREVAYARSGDKGNISNITVLPYDRADLEWLSDSLTAARVSEHFGELVRGSVTRYELPGIGALNFVLEEALDGGVSVSLRADPHGKSYQSLMLDLELPRPPS
jgi:hypothetical protein